ncbi:nickel pincer cofactor biosynthesis protein LarC [Clostridium sp.]|uniref:nickel pincer cofactor biosynthesis protein LarC n=1 Tax=Clostridium sp. TaxID=1506 RepID=UPI001A4D20B1|nr:nickel pincer cofactor biosynthesis protein LarC [Clostridium sp.]MBK5243368.1 nickel pincer cofactor biosynthesis protein LarC [Clostridium sp.]
MKILYYDCFSGISGDMNLGALLELGIDKKYLVEELKKLSLNGYEIKVSKDSRKGIVGTKVDVILQDQHNEHEDEHEHDHSSVEHHHVHATVEQHDHRNIKDIQEIIEHSELSSKVKELSLKMFMKVAEAEAKVHGKPLYEVHFHEVGAVDSIVDIVGAAICISYLNVDKIMSSSVELGGGFVKCAHGIIPVPAPATLEILMGIPVKYGAVPFETTTPTGAAILAANVDEFKEDNNFIVNKIGYGIGDRDTVIPNVLRVMLVEENNLSDTSKGKSEDDSFEEIVECNIDDMNPELYGHIIDKLFTEGALDVYLTPIIMKKGRPGVKISILCKENKLENMKEILFKETTTFGIRNFKVQKTMLERKFVKTNTSYGQVNVQDAYYKGEKIKSKVEYEECKTIADNREIPVREVYDNIKNEL